MTEKYTPEKVAELVADLKNALTARREVMKGGGEIYARAIKALTAVATERDDAREVIEKVREWWYSDDAPKVGHKAYHAMKSILRSTLDKEGSDDA